MTIGLIISHLASKTVATSVQKKVEKDVNRRTKTEEESAPTDFSIPKVESSLTRGDSGLMASKALRLPPIEEIYLEPVSVRLDQKQLRDQTHSNEKEMKQVQELATKIATKLNEELFKLPGKEFATNKRQELVTHTLQVEIFAVSVGNRMSRFFQIGEGYVLLEVGYALNSDSKIVKYGRVKYVDTLAKVSTWKNRCGKTSGADALFAILPTIADQIRQEIGNAPNKRKSELLEIS